MCKHEKPVALAAAATDPVVERKTAASGPSSSVKQQQILKYFK